MLQYYERASQVGWRSLLCCQQYTRPGWAGRRVDEASTVKLRASVIQHWVHRGCKLRSAEAWQHHHAEADEYMGKARGLSCHAGSASGREPSLGAWIQRRPDVRRERRQQGARTVCSLTWRQQRQTAWEQCRAPPLGCQSWIASQGGLPPRESGQPGQSACARGGGCRRAQHLPRPLRPQSA